MAAWKESSWQNILQIVILLGIAIPIGQSVKRFHSIAGPFKIVIKRVERCPVRWDGLTYTLKDVSSRETHKIGPTYNINTTLNFVIDNNITFRGALASWSNMGGWKDNAHSIQLKHVCDVASRWGGNMWIAVLRSIGGEMSSCPYLPGEYRFQNVTFVFKGFPIKHFFYGRWRADAQLLHPNGKTAFCIRAYADTLPR